MFKLIINNDGSMFEKFVVNQDFLINVETGFKKCAEGNVVFLVKLLE